VLHYCLKSVLTTTLNTFGADMNQLYYIISENPDIDRAPQALIEGLIQNLNTSVYAFYGVCVVIMIFRCCCRHRNVFIACILRNYFDG
jgi:hypothetical protein